MTTNSIMQSLLGTNYRMPLLHMSKSYIWLEEKNQRIDEFSIGYMMSQNLNRNRAFRYQVKVCLKNKNFPDTNIHICKKLLKEIQECHHWLNFMRVGEKNYKETVQSVELCNIYYYRKICLY